jgi:alkanesulfonate monooxygenase SsuD/methylene tetrahydromethanopterin reductase-like flavin-dependent oxidoreductase (luciferase family)
LNTVRSPQGQPTFVQAGGSPKGRQFAAKYADSIIAVANGVEGMKSYRDDVRARAAAQGRNPDDIKVLFVVSPVLGTTEEEALARKKASAENPAFFEQSLASISSVTDIDFSQFELDEPLPELETNGERGSLDKFAQWGSGKTPVGRPTRSSWSALPIRSPTRWARPWRRSAVTASSSALRGSARSTSPRSATGSFLRCSARD